MQQPSADGTILKDILIYDPEIKDFVIHLEFNMASKKLHLHHIRREIPENDKDQEIEDENKFKRKKKQVWALQPIESTIIKKIMNIIAFYIWKSCTA